MAKNKTTKWYENRYLVIFIIIGGLFVVFSIGNFFKENGNINIAGTFTLYANSYDENKPCEGDGGYSDINQGAKVTVRNGEGDILTVSDLGEGLADEFGADCVFNFNLNDVPNSKVYQFEVSHRGEVVYSKQQLAEKDFKINLSLGD